MIDYLIRKIVARVWLSRIAKHEAQREKWDAEFMAWKREHPDRCMYCAYVRWVTSKGMMKLTLDPHTCVEGKSPPQPLPRAQVIEGFNR